MSVDKLRTYQQVLINSNSSSPGNSNEKNNNEASNSNTTKNKNKDTIKDRDEKDFERFHPSNCITRSADTIDDSSPFGEMVLSTGTSPSKGLDSDDIVPNVAEEKKSICVVEVEGATVGATNKLSDMDSYVSHGVRREIERRQSHQNSKGEDDDHGSSPSIVSDNLGGESGLESDIKIERNIGPRGTETGTGTGTLLNASRTQDQILSSSANSNGKRDSISGFNASAVSKDGKMLLPVQRTMLSNIQSCAMICLRQISCVSMVS